MHQKFTVPELSVALCPETMGCAAGVLPLPGMSRGHGGDCTPLRSQGAGGGGGRGAAQSVLRNPQAAAWCLPFPSACVGWVWGQRGPRSFRVTELPTTRKNMRGVGNKCSSLCFLAELYFSQVPTLLHDRELQGTLLRDRVSPLSGDPGALPRNGAALLVGGDWCWGGVG